MYQHTSNSLNKPCCRPLPWLMLVTRKWELPHSLLCPLNFCSSFCEDDLPKLPSPPQPEPSSVSPLSTHLLPPGAGTSMDWPETRYPCLALELTGSGAGWGAGGWAEGWEQGQGLGVKTKFDLEGTQKSNQAKNKVRKNFNGKKSQRRSSHRLGGSRTIQGNLVKTQRPSTIQLQSAWPQTSLGLCSLSQSLSRWLKHSPKFENNWLQVL